MKKISKSAAFLLLMMACSAPAAAQFNLGKAASGALKAGKAMTLTDAQMAQYVKESIDWMDKNNRVCTTDDPQTKQYVERLNKLVEGLDEVEGIPLNFKVYYVVDVNAFACPDGSVRVFSSLMDIMTDDELLGVIGHELGHVALKHSKKAYRTALLTSALKDGIASTGGKAAALTDSQLGQLGEAVLNSQFSQKRRVRQTTMVTTSSRRRARTLGLSLCRSRNCSSWRTVPRKALRWTVCCRLTPTRQSASRRCRTVPKPTA